MSKRAVVLLALFILAAATAGTVYKYVDERGVTHYSDNPPAGSTPEEIRTAPAAPAAEAPAAKSWQEQEREFQQRQKAREAADVRESNQAQARRLMDSAKMQLCAQAKARSDYLQRQRHGPAATRNEKGELEYYNFEQREREINEIAGFIERNCPRD